MAQMTHSTTLALLLRSDTKKDLRLCNGASSLRKHNYVHLRIQKVRRKGYVAKVQTPVR